MWPEIEGAFDLGVSSVVEEKDATDKRLARMRLSLSSPGKRKRRRLRQNLTGLKLLDKNVIVLYVLLRRVGTTVSSHRAGRAECAVAVKAIK